MPFFIHVSETEKFKLELVKEQNPDLFKNADSSREYFKVGEDSSLVILPPEEKLSSLNGDNSPEIEIPMLLIQNEQQEKLNFFEMLDQSLKIDKEMLIKLINKHIKKYVKDLDHQLFKLDVLSFSPSGDLSEEAVYVS